MQYHQRKIIYYNFLKEKLYFPGYYMLYYKKLSERKAGKSESYVKDGLKWDMEVKYIRSR